MAGHSKWSNIKHRKAGQDAKRAKVFTKIIRELTVAARDGGGNVDRQGAAVVGTVGRMELRRGQRGFASCGRQAGLCRSVTPNLHHSGPIS